MSIRSLSNKNNKENEEKDSCVLPQTFRKLLVTMKSCYWDRVVSPHSIYSFNRHRAACDHLLRNQEACNTSQSCKQWHYPTG